MQFPSCRTQQTHGLQSENRNTQLMQDANDSILASVAFFVCMYSVRCSFFDLRRMTNVCCVRCVAYGSLETDVRFPSCHTQHNSRTACNAIKTPKYAMHAREKHNAHSRSDSFLCVRCNFWRFSCACIACVALRTTAWKPTFKSVFCILTAAALFQNFAPQPAIGKLLFHDG